MLILSFSVEKVYVIKSLGYTIYFSKARDQKNINMNILHYAKQRSRVRCVSLFYGI